MIGASPVHLSWVLRFAWCQVVEKLGLYKMMWGPTGNGVGRKTALNEGRVTTHMHVYTRVRTCLHTQLPNNIVPLFDSLHACAIVPFCYRVIEALNRLEETGDQSEASSNLGHHARHVRPCAPFATLLQTAQTCTQHAHSTCFSASSSLQRTSSSRCTRLFSTSASSRLASALFRTTQKKKKKTAEAQGKTDGSIPRLNLERRSAGMRWVRAGREGKRRQEFLRRHQTSLADIDPERILLSASFFLVMQK